MNYNFFLYLLRWQASTLILAPVMWYLASSNPWVVAAIANLIGGTIFYEVDRRILCRK